mmetsp:Transcript_29717/g.88183  ORF Transcript_29717/g.88183 Transcript_29717/m.88183 type:complete len:128 (-) Transcript_29717:1086-1469(-)
MTKGKGSSEGRPKTRGLVPVFLGGLGGGEAEKCEGSGGAMEREARDVNYERRKTGGRRHRTVLLRGPRRQSMAGDAHGREKAKIVKGFFFPCPPQKMCTMRHAQQQQPPPRTGTLSKIIVVRPKMKE